MEPDDHHRRPGASPSGFFPGLVLDGRYELVRPLGEGGMGTVWVARQLVLRREVAVKSLRVTSDALRARLRLEALAMASVRHPAVVQVYDYGETAQRTPYIVMELVRGESLGARLDSGGRLSVPEALDLMTPLLEGLAVVHAAGIVHRDIKPENVLLARDERGALWPRLVDFGIAHVEGPHNTKVTVDGSVVGTPGYMSPEQVRGATVDPRTDVWASAVLLYEMLTGAAPFAGDDVPSILRAVLHDAPAYPRDVAGFDGRLWRVLMAALRKPPEARTGSVLALRDELLAWRAGRGGSLTTTRPVTADATDPPRPVALPPAARPDAARTSSMDLLIRGKLGDN